jgi:hypothetical protein
MYSFLKNSFLKLSLRIVFYETRIDPKRALITPTCNPGGQYPRRIFPSAQETRKQKRVQIEMRTIQTCSARIKKIRPLRELSIPYPPRCPRPVRENILRFLPVHTFGG